jgi:hypothetical protein
MLYLNDKLANQMIYNSCLKCNHDDAKNLEDYIFNKINNATINIVIMSNTRLTIFWRVPLF